MNFSSLTFAWARWVEKALQHRCNLPYIGKSFQKKFVTFGRNDVIIRLQPQKHIGRYADVVMETKIEAISRISSYFSK